MAKKRADSADIDWYLISIARLKQIGAVVLILLIGGGAWWFWDKNKANPKEAAEAAIAEARQALNALAGSKEIVAKRSDYDRAQRKLDEATGHLGGARFEQARDAAMESETISRQALTGKTERDYDAQFNTVEGDVQFQKATTNDWKKASDGGPLYNGDWVKTGDQASAILLFANRSLYTVGPNALLEIYSAVNPSTSKRTTAVQMQVGSVEVATADDSSTIRTPGSQVVVESDSGSQVGVNAAKATSVVATKGTASVAPTGGGQAVKLGAGEKVVAAPTGSLSAVTKVVMPPALLTPPDNQVYQVTPESRVEFAWDPLPNAALYQLHVSRSRLFTTLEINSRRDKPNASARVTSEGAFYWRVASIGADGQVGPFSTFRRFRVSGGINTGRTGAADAKPPALRVNKPAPLGGPFFMIEGTTEPGATVFINDEEVDVEAGGRFKKLISLNKVGRNAVIIKAVNPAGKSTIKSETVIVEE